MRRVKVAWWKRRGDTLRAHGKWRENLWHATGDQTSEAVRQILLDNISVGLGNATIQAAMMHNGTHIYT